RTGPHPPSRLSARPARAVLPSALRIPSARALAVESLALAAGSGGGCAGCDGSRRTRRLSRRPGSARFVRARTGAGAPLARLAPAMTGGILLRRIRMLHGTETRRPISRWLRGALVGLLAVAAALFATLGTGVTSPPDAPADNPLPPFELGYLAPSSQAFVAVRPNIFFQQPGMDKLTPLIDQAGAAAKLAGITWPDALRPENVEQMVANVHLSSAGTGKPGSRSLSLGTSSVLVRLNQEFDWPAFLTKLMKELKPFIEKDDVWKHLVEDIKEIRHGDVTIHRLGVLPMLGPTAVHFYMPDRKSVLFFASGSKEEERELLDLIRNVDKARKRDWGTGLKAAPRAPFAFVLDNHDKKNTKK